MTEMTVKISSKTSEDNKIEDAEAAFTFAVREHGLAFTKFTVIDSHQTEVGWTVKLAFDHVGTFEERRT